jgi:hypothetical protein
MLCIGGRTFFHGDNNIEFFAAATCIIIMINMVQRKSLQEDVVVACQPLAHHVCIDVVSGKRVALQVFGFTFLAPLDVLAFTVSSTFSKPVLLRNVDIAPEDIDEKEYLVEIASQLLSLAFLASK